MLLSERDANNAQLARAFLARCSDISDTPEGFPEALLSLSQLRTFEARSPIFTADEVDSAIFGVVYGAVAYVPALGPADANIAHILHPGRWFGFIPLILGTPRNASMEARTRTVVAAISGKDMKNLLAEHPHWWRAIAVLAAKYGNVAANIAADMMITDSSRRCLATLLRLAGCRFCNAAGYPAVAYVSQAELGAMANLSRFSVSRVLQEMTVRGYISVGYLNIQLLDPDALRAIVDNS